MFLGTDIIRTSRLTDSAERFGARFFEKLLSPQEMDDCTRRTPHLPLSHPQVLARLAARISTKEAVAKALKTGLNGLGWSQGIDWHDITIISPDKQAPYIELSGKALKVAQTSGITQWVVSWSHDGDYATATAIGH